MFAIDRYVYIRSDNEKERKENAKSHYGKPLNIISGTLMLKRNGFFFIYIFILLFYFFLCPISVGYCIKYVDNSHCIWGPRTRNWRTKIPFYEKKYQAHLIGNYVTVYVCTSFCHSTLKFLLIFRVFCASRLRYEIATYIVAVTKCKERTFLFLFLRQTMPLNYAHLHFQRALYSLGDLFIVCSSKMMTMNN